MKMDIKEEQIKDNILWELKKHNMTVDDDTMNIMIKAHKDYLDNRQIGVDWNPTQEEYDSVMNQYEEDKLKAKLDILTEDVKTKGWEIDDLWFDNIKWPKYRVRQMYPTTKNKRIYNK